MKKIIILMLLVLTLSIVLLNQSPDKTWFNEQLAKQPGYQARMAITPGELFIQTGLISDIGARI